MLLQLLPGTKSVEKSFDVPGHVCGAFRYFVLKHFKTSKSALVLKIFIFHLFSVEKSLRTFRDFPSNSRFFSGLKRNKKNFEENIEVIDYFLEKNINYTGSVIITNPLKNGLLLSLNI